MRHLVSVLVVALVFIVEARAEGIPIHIAYPQGMNGQIAVAMQEAHLAERHGLEARYTSFQNGPPMMEALVSGTVDAVLTSFMPVTSFLAKLPNDIKVVASLGSSSYSLLVDAGSDVTAAPTLEGKKVGVSFGTDSHLDTLVWLEAQGMAERVRLVNVAPADLVTALATDSVDAIVIREPQAAKLVEDTNARAIQTWPHRYVSVLRTRYIEERPDAVDRYLAALEDGILYIARNKEQTSEWFGKQLRVQPGLVRRLTEANPAYQVSSIEEIEVEVTPETRRLMAEWFDAAFKHQLVKRKIAAESAFVTR